ncbi:MAG: hypothetical protein ABIJ56_18935 [Pseudomonadota bacterium]
MNKKNLLFLFVILLAAHAAGAAENITRGLIALPKDGGSVFLGWRFLLCDDEDTVFNVYRRTGDGGFEFLAGVSDSTNYIDETAGIGLTFDYVVRTVQWGIEGPDSNIATVTASAEGRNYFGFTADAQSIERLVVGDLDGDGFMDYIFIWPKWPDAETGYKLEAFLHDGTHLWTLNPGTGVKSDEPMHSVPFTAWDLDGDAMAEVILRTSESGSPDDYTNDKITVLDGMTKEVKLQEPWFGSIPGGTTENMRNAIAIAHLDGENPTIPSIIIGRGTYNYMKVAAYDTGLAQVWETDLSDFGGSGAHSMDIADIDGDGADEIFYGNMILNAAGDPIWLAPNEPNNNHPDLLAVADIRPDVPGLELMLADETKDEVRHAYAGLSVYSLAEDPEDVYELLWSDMDKMELHVGFLGDFSALHDGMEIWASGSVEDGEGGITGGVHNAMGEVIDVGSDLWGQWPCRWDQGPPIKLAGGRRLLDYDTGATMNFAESGVGAFERGGVIEDVFGDYREEIITQAADGVEVRIYTNTEPITRRKVTLLLDKKYRGDVARTALQYERQVYEGGYYFQVDCPDPPAPEPDGEEPVPDAAEPLPDAGPDAMEDASADVAADSRDAADMGETGEEDGAGDSGCSCSLVL